MNVRDVQEIVRIQLLDMGIEASNIHYDICLNFYRNYGSLPDINHVLAEAIQNGAATDNNGTSLEETPFLEINRNVNSPPAATNHLRGQVYTVDRILQLRNNRNSVPGQLFQNAQMTNVLKVIKNIDTVPIQMYKNIDASNNNSECLICYDQFVPTDIVRILPCNHILHIHCIDDHLKNISHLCPYCKSSAGEYIFKNL